MAEEIKIAYLIIAHTDPEHLKVLVSELTKNADVFIHINKRSDIKPFIKTFADFQAIHKVKFIEKRYRVHWGGYSILKATFELLDNALSTENYDRIILLTGQDYPVKSSNELTNFFTKNKNINYAYSQFFDAENHPVIKFYMYRDNFFLCLLLRFIRKCLPFLTHRKHPNYIEYQGKKFYLRGLTPKWALTGECARYVLDFYKNNPSFNNIMKFLHAPDDFYVATVIYYSKFQESVNNEKDIFYVYYRKISMAQYDEVMKSECLYARKFYSGHSDELIKAIRANWKNEE